MLYQNEKQPPILSYDNLKFDVLCDIPNPVVIIALDTTIIYVNPALEKLTGFSSAELIGCKSPYPYWPKNQKLKYENSFKELLRTGGESYRINLMFRKKNKLPFWATVTSAVIKEAGKSQYVIANWVDSTLLVIANEELRRSEERFRLLAENAKDVIFRIRLLPKLEFEYISPSVTVITGYTPDEFYADSKLMLKIIHPDDSHLMTINRLSLKQPSIFRCTRKDGTLIWIEQQVFLVLDKSGRIMAIEGIDRDISEQKRTEEALLLSEKNFRDSIDNSPVGIRIVGENEETLYTNQALLDLFGYRDIEELISTPLEKRLTAESFAEHLERKRNRKKNRLFDAKYDMYIIRKDGNIRYLEVSRGEVIWNNQKVSQAVYLDMTQRKLAEGELRRSEAFNSNLLINSPNPIIVISQDSTILYVNPSLERLTGFSGHELIGLKRPYPWWLPSNKDGALPNGISDHEMYVPEFKCQKKDGSIFWVSFRTKPIKDKGETIYFLGNWEDITERKVAEAALRESESSYRSLVNNVKLGILRCNPEGRGKFFEVNKAFEEITGYSREELLKIDETSLYAKLDERISFIGKVYQSNGQVCQELIFKRKDGREIIVLAIAAAVRNESGKVKYFDSIVEDITERKRIESKNLEMETLKQLNKAKSELLANVSHELRTPLASIKGFIETLIETDVKWTRSQQLDFLVSANSETDHLNNLIRELLDMSRLESGKMVLEKHNYSFSDILESANPVLSGITAKHRLELNLPEQLPPINVDKLRIIQVITNLVENAAKFSPEGSLITISAEAKNDNFIISVSDRGEGISEEGVDNLFNRFYQAKRVVSGKTRGTGLGLAICKGIVEAHGGKIWVKSKLGESSIFNFSIPVSSKIVSLSLPE